MAAATLGGFTSCQDKFDDPADAMQPAVATIQANTSIFDLKREFWDDATNYIKEIGTKADGSHYIVAGRVITTDEPGNIFKSITIQDETAALTFSVNTYNLFLQYRVGQELVVDLTGLHIGKYNGLQQIGAPEWYEQGNAWEATFMAPEVFYTHVQRNGLPEADKVIVHELASISDIPSGADGLCAWQSQLVRLNNVTFLPQVNSNTGETVTTFGIYKENFNQKVLLDGTELTLRTSGYSDFFNEEMPTASCDMTCLLSYYGSAWQIQLINSSDIINIGNPTLPSGTEENPWNIEDAIGMIEAGETPVGWTRGYIVGTVAPEVTTVSSNDDIEWGESPVLANTVVLAPEADCRDYTRCIIVPLPQGSVLRQYVAVKDHPENLGKTLDIYGTLDTYLGTFGVTGNNGTASEFNLEGVEVPDTPGPGTQGDGTEANPYNCAQVIALDPQSTTDAVKSGVWVSGYIVGYYNNYEPHFTADGAVATNILISDSPSASDKSQCVCIQLVSKTETRSALNLLDNPANLGKTVSVFGDVMKYNTLPGIKNTSDYKLDSGGVTPDPGPSTGLSDGDGTQAKPYTAGQVVAMGADANVANTWVTGYIVGWVDNAIQNYADAKNCVFTTPATVATNVLLANSPDVTDFTKCCVVNLPNSNNIRATVNLVDNPGNLGKIVTVNGTIRKYFGIPGVRDLTAASVEDGGSTPTPTPTPGGSIFSALSENATSIDWTFDNGTLPTGLTYIWQWKEYNSKYYLNGSAFANNTAYASEAYAISPVIDLTGHSTAKLTFDHAAKFQTTLKTLCGLVVREAGTTAWTPLTIPTWPAAGAWTFASSGEISLNAYAGKKIEIAFKYGSSTAGADTWEIKNLVITE